MEYIDHSYRIGIVTSLQKESSFYKQLPPELKNKLTFCLLDDYY